MRQMHDNAELERKSWLEAMQHPQEVEAPSGWLVLLYVLLAAAAMLITGWLRNL